MPGGDGGEPIAEGVEGPGRAPPPLARPDLPLRGLAALVLAHENAAQLGRLLGWLSGAGATAFLHLDPRAGAVRRAIAPALPEGARLLPEAACRRIAWGGYAMIEATLTLMRAALADPTTQHLCLLSGSHLPVQPPQRIAEFLFDGREHMDLRLAAAEPPERESLRRFWHRGLPGREGEQPVLRWANHNAWRLGRRDVARGLRGLTPMVGSQWWHMTAACARDLLAFLDANPWYAAFFRAGARIPDESFFQTLLAASPHGSRLGEPPSWQWIEAFSPRIVGATELAAARASGRPFARKFDSSREPLAVTDALDAATAPSPRRAPPIARGPGLPDGLRPIGPEPAPRPGEILAVMVVRNEALRLPCVLRDLRALGVDCVMLLDNRSEDGTRTVAAAEPGVHLFDAPGSYAGSNFGLAWMNPVLDRYARGHWTLVWDADQILVFPGRGPAGLRALCAHLDALGSEAMTAMLLDCFPEGPLSAVGFRPGDDLLDAAPWFEPGPFRREPADQFPHFQTYGGLRERLFFPEADPRRPGRWLRQRLYNLGWRVPGLRSQGWYRAMAPRRSPNLTIVPLLRWREGARLLAATHLTAPMTLAAEQPSGVALHFKFLQDFQARAEDAVARDAHFDGSREYRRYLEALRADPGFRLHSSRAVRYAGPEQLVSLGLMHDSAAWRAARARS